mgnify:CR=1 FL=1
MEIIVLGEEKLEGAGGGGGGGGLDDGSQDTRHGMPS